MNELNSTAILCRFQPIWPYRAGIGLFSDTQQLYLQQDESGNTFLHLAARHQSPEGFKQVLQLISTCLKDVMSIKNNKGRTVLHNAGLRAQNISILLQLLKWITTFHDSGEFFMNIICSIFLH